MSKLPPFPEPDGAISIKGVEVDAWSEASMLAYGQLCKRWAFEEAIVACSAAQTRYLGKPQHSINPFYICIKAISNERGA